MGQEFGDDLVFEGFGVLDSERVMIVHEKNRIASGPNIKHSPVDNVSKRTLRIISDSFT